MTSMDMPTKSGLYKVRSKASDNEWHSIIIMENQGVLMVHTPYTGTYPLSEYHAGLTDAEWEICTINK
jgi:hypothetical protein